MFDIRELKRFKNICAEIKKLGNDFDFTFTKINENKYTIVATNGIEYCRVIGDLLGCANFDLFQISQKDFIAICTFFEKKVNVKIDDMIITFFDDFKKYKCLNLKNDYYKRANFSFDFNKSYKINMDECIILKDLGVSKCIAIYDKYLMSTDNNCATLTTFDKSITGENIFTFVKIFPSGTWFFSPESKVIVSEDKKIAVSIAQSDKKYPNKALLTLSNFPLNNFFEVEAKNFINAIDECQIVSDTLKIIFENKNIVLKASNFQQNNNLTLKINANYDHVTQKKEIKFSQRYAQYFKNFVDNKKIKIYFDDAENNYMLRAEYKTNKLFFNGMI